MLDYNEPRNQLSKMRTEMVRAYESINPDKMRARIAELEKSRMRTDFGTIPTTQKKSAAR